MISAVTHLERDSGVIIPRAFLVVVVAYRPYECEWFSNEDVCLVYIGSLLDFRVADTA
jgi:hypothetical protein